MAEKNLEPNQIPCGGYENEKNGCQEIFPRNPSDLCQRCKKMNAPGISDIDMKNLEALNVCASCGICGRNIGNPCGSCHRKDEEAKGVVDSAKQAAASERYSRAQRSFGTNRPTFTPASQTHEYQSAQTTIGATTTPENLAAARTISLAGIWTVHYRVRTDKGRGQPDKGLGSGNVPFLGDVTMPDVLDGIIQQVNPLWTKREGNTLDLILSECELRFQNNIIFAQEAQTMTIKDFYHYYLNRPDRYLLDSTDKQLKMAKGTFLPLDIYVHDTRYIEHIQQGLDMVTMVKGKRSASQAAQASSKRTKTGPLVSTFQMDRGPSFPWNGTKKEVTPITAITFTMITCNIDPTTSKPSLIESSDTIKGEIGQKTLAIGGADRGRSKNVYKFTMANRANKTFVAKSFMPAVIKDGSNAVYILQELVRIKRLQSFAAKFQEDADTLAVEIAEFQVSDAFMITLDGDQTHKSLPSSDFLVEPLCASTAVLKFSGTFGASNKKDKLSATMTAFAHFIAEQTACQLVFADLQGSVDYKPGGPKTMVLFDPMTHSPFQATGLGDFGIQGIQDFIDSHECSIICGHLGLADKDSLQDALTVQSDTVKESKEAGTFEDEQEILTIEKAANAPGGDAGSDKENEPGGPWDQEAHQPRQPANKKIGDAADDKEDDEDIPEKITRLVDY